MWHELVDQLQAVYLFYSKHFEFSYLPDTLLLPQLAIIILLSQLL